MAEGRSNAGIGRQLWVTEGTVEKHVRSILMKPRLPETADDHRRVLGVGSAGRRDRPPMRRAVVGCLRGNERARLVDDVAQLRVPDTRRLGQTQVRKRQAVAVEGEEVSRARRRGGRRRSRMSVGRRRELERSTASSVPSWWRWQVASGNIAERQMSFGGFCHGLFFLDQKIVELGSWG